jgi:pre-rRNA-processing protein IPI3
VVGHSCSRNNIAITTAKDSTAIVWDYHTGRILRTFLLPSTALSIAIDPADRAFFVGYETGNVQIVDFYKNHSIQHPLHDVNLQATPSQLLADDQWLPPSTDFGAAECLTLSYDGTKLLSGHRNGNILSWDVARSKYGSTVADYTHPVTNIQMLPPAGFPQQSANDSSTVTVHNVVKPRYDHHMADSLQATTLIPSNYSFNAQLTSLSPQPYVSTSAEKYSSKQVELSEALVHPFFPRFLIDEGLAELSAFDQGHSVNDEAMQGSLLPSISDGDSASSSALGSQVQSLEAEIITLKKRLSINETARRNTTDEVVKLRSDLVQWQDYANELQSRQERSQQEKVLARARKEERDLKRRQAWFEAEKRGENGDAIVRKMKAEDGSDTSDSEARSNDPN